MWAQAAGADRDEVLRQWLGQHEGDGTQMARAGQGMSFQIA